MLDQKEERQKKKDSKRVSLAEGCAYSVSDGAAMRNMTPYALSLGASSVHVGVLSTLPSLVGSFAQLVTLRLMYKMSRKRVILYGVVLQALGWLVLLGIGLLFNAGLSLFTPTLVVVAYTLLVTFGFSISPAWSSWMRDIVEEKRGTYFGTRNRICGMVALVSMIGAGVLLDYFKKTNVIYGFIIIFCAAFIARMMSAYFFRKMYDPEFRPYKNSYTLAYSLLKLRRQLFGKFLVFVSLVLFSTAIAAPFFAVYALEELHFSYTAFTMVMISAPIGTLLLMPAWGRFTDRYGNRKAMWISGFLIPLIPIGWLCSFFISQENVVPYLIAIELFSGFVWAGFNLATGNYVYDIVPRDKLPWYSAYFNIVTNVSSFAGALVGGILAVMPISIWGSSLLFIFVISGIARFLSFIATAAAVKEIRAFEELDIDQATKKFRSLSVWDILRILR